MYLCVCVYIYVYIYIHIYIYIYYIFIHSSVDGHLGGFHVLAIVNSAMNIGVHVSFRISGFSGGRYIPKSGIVGSYGSFLFNFLRNLHIFPLWLHDLHSQRFNVLPPHWTAVLGCKVRWGL